MRWIIELLFRNRTAASMVVTVAASLLLISAPQSAQLTVVRVMTLSIFYPLQVTVDQITTAKNIYAENRRLRTDVASLNAQVTRLRDQEAENNRLRDMLGFRQTFPYDLIPVKVVARDPSPVFKSIVVSAGKQDGVLPFMPVVCRQGVVGKIVQVLPNLSLVQLIRDPLNHVSVMTQRNRTVSILETENGIEFFSHYRVHEDVQRGDTIITTGLGGIYPRGLPVGVIEKISFGRDPLFKRAIIKLSLDIDHLEELFIVKLPPQWAAYKEQLDSVKLKP